MDNQSADDRSKRAN